MNPNTYSYLIMFGVVLFSVVLFVFFSWITLLLVPFARLYVAQERVFAKLIKYKHPLFERIVQIEYDRMTNNKWDLWNTFSYFNQDQVTIE